VFAGPRGLRQPILFRLAGVFGFGRVLFGRQWAAREKAGGGTLVVMNPGEQLIEGEAVWSAVMLQWPSRSTYCSTNWSPLPSRRVSSLYQPVVEAGTSGS